MDSADIAIMRTITRICAIVFGSLAFIVGVNVLTPNDPEPPKTFIQQAEDACSPDSPTQVNVKNQTFSCND